VYIDVDMIIKAASLLAAYGIFGRRSIISWHSDIGLDSPRVGLYSHGSSGGAVDCGSNPLSPVICKKGEPGKLLKVCPAMDG
jgi:hypothetical protein